MQTRWKEMAFALPLAAVVMLGYFEAFPLYPSDQLSEYPTTRGVVSELRVERFYGRRWNDYFEYTIYLDNDRRFFFRKPSENDFHRGLQALTKDMPVVISHLQDEEDGRGHRVANIASGPRTIYSLDDALEEMRSKQVFIRYFALILFAMGVASFVVYRRKAASNVQSAA